MGKLHAAARNALPDSDFGLPAERKYPVEDKAHAANAKARASQAEHAGRITPGQEHAIDRKADHVLHDAGSPMPNTHKPGSRGFK